MIPAAIEDSRIIADLKDALQENRSGCVGMAANMIGALKRIIIVSTGFVDIAMVNPVITKKSGRYETEWATFLFRGCAGQNDIRKLKW